MTALLQDIQVETVINCRISVLCTVHFAMACILRLIRRAIRGYPHPTLDPPEPNAYEYPDLHPILDDIFEPWSVIAPPPEALDWIQQERDDRWAGGQEAVTQTTLINVRRDL